VQQKRERSWFSNRTKHNGWFKTGFMGIPAADFLADKLVNLGIREMPEPNKSHMPEYSGMVFR
jgi:hypothetical protein